MSTNEKTQRKEVHLDDAVVNALNDMAASMRPPIKVKKLMEMILEDHANGSGGRGTPVAVPVKAKKKALGPGQEPGILELEIQRQSAKKDITLLKLESKLANSLPANRYREIMATAIVPETETRESICKQLRSRFNNLTTVLTAAGQAIEDMTMKVCDSHVILGDHLCEYMISYGYETE